MSNPLALFRKHQKILLVVFGVALMVVFTIGGIVSQSMSMRSPSRQNAEVVKLKSSPTSSSFETLRESDLDSMRYSRQFLRQFMRTVNAEAAARGATPKQYLGVPDSVDERSLLQTLILSQKAEEMGLVVTDENIVNFLRRYTDQTVSAGEFGNIVKQMSQGRMSTTMFFNAMRREMLALRFQDLFRQGIFPSTPAAYWDFYQRLNRQVAIEAVPFNVAEYLDRAPEPSAAEINKEYEEYKDRYAFPSSPTPGFKERKRIEFQYAQADLATFLDEEKSKITNEQIEAYYNENKEEFRNATLPNESDFGIDISSPAGDVEIQETEIDTNTDPVENGEEAEASSETTDNTEDSSEPTESTEPEVETDCGLFQEEGEEEPATEEPAAEEPATEEPAAEEPAAEEPATEEPAAETTSTDESTEASDSEGEATTADADDLTDILGEDTDPEIPAEETLPEYKPLEEVKEDIRTLLATPIAADRMKKAVNAVRAEMRDYNVDYIGWNVSEDRDTVPEPTPPDLRDIAAKHGLTFGSTPLVNIIEIGETDPITDEPKYPISQAFTMNFQPFAQVGFGNNLGLYEPSTIPGREQDRTYLFWKTAEVPEEVPLLDDIRGDVVRDLKMKTALSYAQEAAKAAAEELRKNNQSPADAYRTDPNKEVIESGQFTWMTAPSVPYLPARLSTIPGIRFAGNDFMKEVFSLDKGDIGVASDNPEKTVYLVYLKSEASDPDQLKENFLRTGPSFEVQNLAASEARNLLSEWYTEYEKELEVEWIREPMTDSQQR